jgi:hypothetical protein
VPGFFFCAKRRPRAGGDDVDVAIATTGRIPRADVMVVNTTVALPTCGFAAKCRVNSYRACQVFFIFR